MSQVPFSRWRHGSGLSPSSFLLGKRQHWQEKGHCSVCLVPGPCTGEARAKPGPGAVPMCSSSPSMPESFCATLGRRDGWEVKGLFSAACPEKPTALGCAWHEQQVALGVASMAQFCWAFCAWLGPCSAESSVPAAPVGSKSHGKLPTAEQKDTGEGWGKPESAATQQVASW